MDEEQRAAVRSQIGKNVVKVYAVCWDLLYSLSQINMPRYAHQEIALAERRIRDKTQKALHALTFLFAACCSLPTHCRLLCQLAQSACHWRRF